MGKLTAVRSLLPESLPIAETKEPNWRDIPSEVIGYRETYTNCTSLEQSITFKHTETTRVGARVSKTKQIANTEKIDANLEFRYADVISGGVSVGFSKTITITDAAEESYEDNRTFDSTVPLRIAANTRVVMDHRWIRREVPIVFTGIITTDGAVAPNQEGIGRISQVLTNISDRKFEFAGVVTSSTLVEGDTTVRETRMNPNECARLPGFSRLPEHYREMLP
jgi:hypothetical protein